MTYRFGPDHPDETYVAHGYPEQTIDLGELVMNYAAAGPVDAPALLLIPGQSESWWGYEPAMAIPEASFRVHAVDLRGQGRSSRTPGRYTLDNMGNDLVRFIRQAINRPTVVSGLSSGGVLAARVRALVEAAGQTFDYRSFPTMGHSMHGQDPALFAATLTEWALAL